MIPPTTNWQNRWQRCKQSAHVTLRLLLWVSPDLDENKRWRENKFYNPLRHLLLCKNAWRSEKRRPVIFKNDLQSPGAIAKKKHPSLCWRHRRHQRSTTRSHIKLGRNLCQPPKSEPKPQPRKMCFWGTQGKDLGMPGLNQRHRSKPRQNRSSL